MNSFALMSRQPRLRSTTCAHCSCCGEGACVRGPDNGCPVDLNSVTSCPCLAE